MNREPRVFATIDLGTATASVALIGRVDGRWRLLGSASAPARVGPEPLIARLAARLADVDPALAQAVGLPVTARAGMPDAAAADAVAELSRLICRTAPPPRVVVLAASARVLGPLVAVAGAAGLQPRGLCLDDVSLVDVVAALADPSVATVVAGASDPPGADERALLPQLVEILAAAVQRRPELTVVLAGGLADPGGRTERLLQGDRPGALLLGPAALAGDPPGAPLRELLDVHHAAPDDGRHAMARAAGTLSGVLERRIEVMDVGQSSGTRVAAVPGAAGRPARVTSATAPGGCLVPAGVDDAAVDAVGMWLTIPIDRLRLRDRLRELAIDPWADPAGDGALLRLAAARAALVRLTAATPWFDRGERPELVVAAGGAWAVAPGPAVALALADTIRRPGASGLGLDHARLLGPLGRIEDGAERRAMLTDLRDDLLTPLGTVIMAAGMRSGGSGGRLTVHAADGPVELELVPGGLELVDLPPGQRATVELRFRDPVDLGIRGRHFAVEVGGGLGGLLVDLRDVPLRLPDRAERRRDVLAAWQSALWADIET